MSNNKLKLNSEADKQRQDERLSTRLSICSALLYHTSSIPNRMILAISSGALL